MQGSSSSSGSDASLILKRCIVLDAIVRAVGREISRRRFPGVSPCWICVVCSHINHLHEPLHAPSASNQPTSLSVRLSICTKNSYSTVGLQYTLVWCGGHPS